jgi:Flp pilus assembly protein TadD
MLHKSGKTNKALWESSLFALLLIAISSGCASSSLQTGRNRFYAGSFDDAALVLASEPESKDEVLRLMELGTTKQAAGNHAEAIDSWLDAADRIKELDYIRVSEKTTSLIVNDTTQTYTGRPYERALLHAFTAKSFFALGKWRSAAVEARRLADGLQDRNGFPDDAYARYVAAVAFEMIRDFNGSRIEYTKANEITPQLTIAPQYGLITPGTNTQQSVTPPEKQLICFVGIGRAPLFNMGAHPRNVRWGLNPYMEVRSGNMVLGRSYSLSTTTSLAAETQRRIAAIQAAKTVTRIVIKESIADAVSDDNPLLGELLRIFLYATEVPDTRSWQTLPNWLQVARVPLPENTSNIQLVFKTSSGATMKIIEVPTDLPGKDGKSVFTARAW